MAFVTLKSRLFIFTLAFSVSIISFSHKASASNINDTSVHEENDSRFLNELSPVQKLQLENKKALALASFARILNIIETQYVDPESIESDKRIDKALAALVSNLDPHSSYLTSEQFSKFVTVSPKENEHTSSVSVVDLSHRVAYLKLSIFNSESYHEVSNKLNNYKNTHNDTINGLILDLRNNPGGLFDQSIQIANLFVDSGIIVSTLGRDRKKPQDVQYALKYQTFKKFPIIVLVNENTASASEILAGALQDRDRAIIMGSTTYGKGSVQKVVPLPNGGAIKLTVARYYTPSGRSLQAEGILPDVMFIPHGEKKLPRSIRNKSLQINSQSSSVYREIEQWNDKLQTDYEIKQAYLYLRRSL